MIFHGIVSEYSNKHFNNFNLVTFVTFAVPNVNNMMILGVPTYKMSMENNLVLTWHILTGRGVFASLSFVAPHTYILSWAPNSCCSCSSVLSATCWKSRCKLTLHVSVCTPSCSVRLLTSLPFHPYPGEMETPNFLVSPASSSFCCGLVTAYPCSESLSCLSATEVSLLLTEKSVMHLLAGFWPGVMLWFLSLLGESSEVWTYFSNWWGGQSTNKCYLYLKNFSRKWGDGFVRWKANCCQ